jgi:uncharacterized protein (TIGR02246 family)
MFVHAAAFPAAVVQSHEGLASREMIASLFDAWNQALATKDPNKVADLYAHDAVLLPTVSNEVRHNIECAVLASGAAAGVEGLFTRPVWCHYT